MASKRPAKKATEKKPASATTRKLKQPSYRSFRLSKRIKHPAPALRKARKIFSAAVRHVLAHKRLYAGIGLVYLLLTLVLVKGLGFGFDSQLTEVRATIEEALGEQSSPFITSAALFGLLLGSAGSAGNEASSIYQLLLLVLVSLALIWALRQTYAKEHPKVKDAYYKGMYPLVPYLLVLGVVLLQLVPLAIGNFIYGIVIGNGLAVTGLEQFVWAVIFALFALVTFYMLSSSLFALYIVTLPDVTPMQALRSARELVRHRRLMVARKVLFLPFILLILAVVFMVPILLYATAIAEVVFFTFTILAIVVIHAYMYELYRELL